MAVASFLSCSTKIHIEIAKYQYKSEWKKLGSLLMNYERFTDTLFRLFDNPSHGLRTYPISPGPLLNQRPESKQSFRNS